MTRPHVASWIAQARWVSPLGPVTLAATAAGLAGLWFDGQRHHPGALHAPQCPENPHLALAINELSRYFGGRLRHFSVPLDLQGTPFQHAIWQALRTLAPGTTATYADIAQTVGRPQASRAAGTAIGRNPVSIIVPCHRVLGRDGTLTGYAGGLDRKAALLALEASTG